MFSTGIKELVDIIIINHPANVCRLHVKNKHNSEEPQLNYLIVETSQMKITKVN